MDEICTINIKGKECSLEFQVKKYCLYSYSRYFRSFIDKDKKLTEFAYSNTSFGKKIYTLYFSEFHTKNIPKCQITSDIDDSDLYELLQLNEIFQSDIIQEKIYDIFIKNKSIEYLIQKFSNKRRENHDQDEKMILEKLNENNIKKFLESNVKQERKIRILSKLQKMKPNNNDLQRIVKEYIFNIQKEGNKEENREIFMINYSTKEIYKEKRKFNLRNEKIILPNIKDLIQEEKEIFQQKETKEKIENLEKSEKETKEKIENLEKLEKETKEKQEKLEKSEKETKEKIENLEKSEKETKEKQEKSEKETKEKIENLEKSEKETKEKIEKLEREKLEREKKEKEEILMKSFEEEYQKDSNYQNDREGFSRLHFAATKNYKEAGEILVTRGADVNAKDIIYQIIEILFLIKRI